MYNVYKVIDSIESSNIKKRLERIKREINNDKNKLDLINKFNKAKELKEKYGLDEEFIRLKKDLFKDEIINEYLKLQNEINMLSLYINKKIKDLTSK